MTHASKPGAPPMPCSICSQLSDREYGYQKGGRPEEDLHLPAAANGLKTVQLNSRNSTGSLQQCTECGTYYLYETTYEFLVNGSEEEQILTRLTEEQAIQFMEGTS